MKEELSGQKRWSEGEREGAVWHKRKARGKERAREVVWHRRKARERERAARSLAVADIADCTLLGHTRRS